MNVKNSRKCSYCDDVDFIEHFFYECKVAKELWKCVEEDALIMTGQRLQLSLNDVLFGVKGKNTVSLKDIVKLNHLILIGKMCISKYKKTECHSLIRFMYEFEKSIRLFDTL